MGSEELENLKNWGYTSLMFLRKIKELESFEEKIKVRGFVGTHGSLFLSIKSSHCINTELISIEAT